MSKPKEKEYDYLHEKGKLDAFNIVLKYISTLPASYAVKKVIAKIDKEKAKVRKRILSKEDY